mmetsp:Transcript_1686/g.6383  ORF Transcript_1686/g.6383 Transcript_1686/m.6383 type:complete len:307 (-) Transcript_1686:3112-4032(-)
MRDACSTSAVVVVVLLLLLFVITLIPSWCWLTLTRSIISEYIVDPPVSHGLAPAVLGLGLRLGLRRRLSSGCRLRLLHRVVRVTGNDHAAVDYLRALGPSLPLLPPRPASSSPAAAAAGRRDPLRRALVASCVVTAVASPLLALHRGRRAPAAPALPFFAQRQLTLARRGDVPRAAPLLKHPQESSLGQAVVVPLGLPRRGPPSPSPAPIAVVLRAQDVLDHVLHLQSLGADDFLASGSRFDLDGRDVPVANLLGNLVVLHQARSARVFFVVGALSFSVHLLEELHLLVAPGDHDVDLLVVGQVTP